MSVSCHPERQSGFTLLEMLVVLVIMAMAVGVVAPRLQSTYEAVNRSGERAGVMLSLGQLPQIARSKSGLRLDAGATQLDALLRLPEGWHLVPEQAMVIEPSGACRGAVLALRAPDSAKSERIVLQAPDCAVDDAH